MSAWESWLPVNSSRDSIVFFGRGSAFLALAFAVVLLAAGNAWAGSFTVVSCDGSTASAGWSTFAVNAPPGSIFNPTCSAGWPQVEGEWLGAFPPAMEAGLPGGSPSSFPPGATAGLVFTAPAGDGIVGGEVWVYGQSIPATA